MKKFLLYTAGGTTIFAAGAVTGIVVLGRMVIPVIDTEKVVGKMVNGVDKSRRMLEQRLFGDVPAAKYATYNTTRLSRVPDGEGI